MLFYLEWLAVALGIINITLLIRRSVWNYPFGIVMVALYFVIFSNVKLYGEAALQIFFVLVQIYGWIRWREVQAQSGEVVVSWSGPRTIVAVAALTTALVFGLSLVMARYTDAAAPLPDATITVMSVTAQVLMVLRRVESWAYWIAVDVLAVWLFYTRDLLPTSGLYAVFLALACVGLAQWMRALKTAHPKPAPEPASK